MEKDRRFKTIGLVAILVAVVGLSIAFAALSQTLTINGTAKAEKGLWQIKFVDSAVDQNASKTTPTVTPQRSSGASADNTISVSDAGLSLTYSANLKTPGDKVTYKAIIKNYGTIDGQIDVVGANTLINGDSAKAAKILDIKTYYTSDGKEPTSGDVIKAGSEDEITIEVTYKTDIDVVDLPSTDETFVYKYTISYKQATTVAQTNTHTAQNAIVASEVPEEPVANNCTSFTKKNTYDIGDVVAICNETTGKSEDFYVMSDNGTNVTALAKYKLYIGTNYKFNISTTDDAKTPVDLNDPEYGIQSAETAILSKDGYNRWNAYIPFYATNSTPYWVENNTLKSSYGNSYPAFVYDSNSNLVQYATSYQTYLNTSINSNSVTVSVPSLDQMLLLGCTISTCDTETVTSNNRTWIYNTDEYWLGTVADNNYIYSVRRTGSLFNYTVTTDYIGFRPTITINKAVLNNLDNAHD